MALCTYDSLIRIQEAGYGSLCSFDIWDKWRLCRIGPTTLF